MDGWIKLHRKLIENEIYIHDPTAWRIFCHLLLIVDRRTGKRNAGRYQIGHDLEINPNTVYSALKRLEKAKMVNIKSNNKYSVISIVNWGFYQDSSTAPSTTNQQQINTKQEVKNKEVIYGDNTKAIAELLEVAPTEGLDRYLNDSYKDYKFKNMTLRMVEWCRENKKQPTIARWMNWVRRAEVRGELERKGDK